MRIHWQKGIDWVKPGYVWSDSHGTVPAVAQPRPIGTAAVHHGRRLDSQRYQLDVRLVGGEIRAGAILRRQIRKHSWIGRVIADVRTRSAELPGELEVDILDEETEDPGPLQDWLLIDGAERFWQVAVETE